MPLNPQHHAFGQVQMPCTSRNIPGPFHTFHPKFEHNLYRSLHTCDVIMPPSFITENTEIALKAVAFADIIVLDTQGNCDRIKVQRDISACILCLCLAEGTQINCSP